MKSNKTYNTVALCALIVAVAGLTIGFAAFSNTLTINSSANVAPSSSTLDIAFSTAIDSKTNGTVTGVPTTGATGGTATISGTTISDVTAHFTAPGQSVTYSFYV